MRVEGRYVGEGSRRVGEVAVAGVSLISAVFLKGFGGRVRAGSVSDAELPEVDGGCGLPADAGRRVGGAGADGEQVVYRGGGKVSGLACALVVAGPPRPLSEVLGQYVSGPVEAEPSHGVVPACQGLEQEQSRLLLDGAATGKARSVVRPAGSAMIHQSWRTVQARPAAAATFRACSRPLQEER